MMAAATACPPFIAIHLNVGQTLFGMPSWADDLSPNFGYRPASQAKSINMPAKTPSWADTFSSNLALRTTFRTNPGYMLAEMPSWTDSGSPSLWFLPVR
ncbi:MAG: hypothetical protein PUF51_03740 [Bifidobacteriaceae bacterium]|nr:hypothetical protein [Bifidobacteriaceae bacterium]